MTHTDRVFLIAISCLLVWTAVPYVERHLFDPHSHLWHLYLALPLLVAVVTWALPSNDISRSLKKFMKAWFSALWSYCLAVTVSAVLLLVGLSALGYLPYSDRPGPGWGNISPHLPTLEEIEYFGGWAAIVLLPICYFLGSLLFVFMAWTRWLSAPVWLSRAAGAAFCGGLSMVAVAAAGWYIAIAVTVTNTVGLCASIFGAIILSRISVQREMRLSLAVRGVGITLACLGMAAFLVYPFVRSR